MKESIPLPPFQFIYPDNQILKEILPRKSPIQANKNGKITLVKDLDKLETIYNESPLILNSSFEIIKLIDLGKCCCRCGDVLKIYDRGIFKDSGLEHPNNKEKDVVVHSNLTDEKLARYMSGLDCSACELRWCSDQCKRLDFRHGLLNHMPMNASMTNNINSSDHDKISLKFALWKNFKKLLMDENREDIYYTFCIILELYYYKPLVKQYENLRRLEGDEVQMLKYLQSLNQKRYDKAILQKFYDLIIGVFNKKLKLTFKQFLNYLIIFKLNNFENSIYVITSCIINDIDNNLDDESITSANCSIDYADATPNKDYEDVKIEPIGNHSVKLTKQQHNQESSSKCIYSHPLKIPRKIIKVSNLSMLSKSDELKVTSTSAFTPSFSILCQRKGSISSGSSLDSEVRSHFSKPQMFELPANNTTQVQKQRSSSVSSNSLQPITTKAKTGRTASFTSSGTSFGEGIIKYNRDQIREMLTKMTINQSSTGDQELIEEDDDESSDDDEGDSDDFVGNNGIGKNTPQPFGSDKRRGSHVYEVLDGSISLTVPESFGSNRAKRVSFKETITEYD
ncbi:hypothetical protein CANARDRAFT_5371 [[Candida] arabinofermentans NRRL YB-2248]|uniref:Uncharacterized protein n=1 Tax=[Candida] arabinofermentans NRRL YB-2248 TaxID=983967 RepID=A0A1E4T8I1_9ASCO|nr:hypothetical protein CANARDRAFT_5371 [[Candida] arabinofermentans NRRL YB-2248]